ncbi:signal peptidase I [Streptococcus suis]|uniref:signal peptidase I n=1 Tax=Streptococcus suis TaxID=1307 RepID=UPI0004130AE8|nr:signal peptidase I [Streptococcus suis]MBO4131248.1 signal peptidase I [Streptococcus suis]MBO4132760.1 signal peptidase I [Streptococcus suis]MBY4960754.1 signal peptidase I [Streptococcus suis]MCE6985697.1 signal peptidase I [Streptococcus suis]HEM3169941.1 signal peptidase I [Streptococcus suis 89-3576-3]
MVTNKNKDYVTISDLPSISIMSEELDKIRYKERYLEILKNTIFTLVTVAALAVLIAMLWLPVLHVYASSMSPTLEAGDTVATVKTNTLSTGDMVAFYYNNKVLVKRVVATSGQWVNIDEQGNVYVNGKTLDEPYVKDKVYGQTDIKLPYQVPEGQYFVMGDHRSVSIDSRNTAIGSIGEEQLVGKLTFRIWPFHKMGVIK